MSQHQRRPSGFQVSLATIVTVLGFSILVACGTTQEASVPQVVATIASTTAIPQITGTLPPSVTVTRSTLPGTPAPTRVVIIRTPEPIPTLDPGNSKAAFDTRVAQRESADKTVWALTPTSVPGTPTSISSSQPTATEVLGWLDCGGMASSQDPSYDSCWQGMVNGQFLSVKTGRQGRRGDISQGIITLSELGLDDRFHDIGTYLTPLRQGSVEMASMDGTRVYLVRSTTPQPPDVDVTPTPGVIFVFDLATRQWLDPNGTPIPSPTFTPTP